MESYFKKIAEYFSDKEEITAVYLFGSHASGKQRPMSDVDVGIVVDDNQFRPNHAMRLREKYMLGLSRVMRKDVHVVILNGVGEMLLSQVLSKGKCVLVNSERKLALFKANAFLKIIDFEYYRNLFQKKFLQDLGAS